MRTVASGLDERYEIDRLYTNQKFDYETYVFLRNLNDRLVMALENEQTLNARLNKKLDKIKAALEEA